MTRVAIVTCLLRAIGTWFALSLAAASQEPLVARGELKGVERLATEIAKAGHQDAWQRLLSVLARSGTPDKDLAALRSAGEKELGRRKKPPEAGDRLAKQLAAETAKLGDLLTRQSGEAAQQLARLVLQLDADVAAAHTVLGHDRTAVGWGPAGAAARAERAIARQRALQQCRRLVPEFAVDEPRGETSDGWGCGQAGVVLQSLGRPIVRARSGKYTVLSTRPVAPTTRIVAQAVRGAAMAEFALTGVVAVPAFPATRLAMVESRALYDQAVAAASAKGLVNAKQVAESKVLSTLIFGDGSMIDFDVMEADTSAVLVVDLVSQRLREPALQAGLVNWICRAMLGTSIPSYTWNEVSEARRAARTATQDPKLAALRSEMMRLADAGLAGGRAWLRFLASQREDPPWADAMVDEIGKIQGEELLKTTFVAEYLLDEGLFGAVAAKVREASEPTAPERFARALGMPLTEVDERFREWIAGIAPGVVQRLAPAPGVELPRDAQNTLAALARTRSAAFGASSSTIGAIEPPGIDAESSAGCVAHAKYLAAHPEMAARWPDAHEENSDHADWSAAGAWAGGHAVIAPGVKTGEEALLAWMGTFFHRTPLLEPGLLRIGYGFAGGVAVLDSGSLVGPRRDAWQVAWPPHGATDVPTRFVPELPNPVPGEDQSQWGYPITLQVGTTVDSKAPQIEMRLLEGGQSGREVPCWFSSPQKPLNVEIAPANSFCLIPKAPLRPGAKYTVVARAAGGEPIVWSWQTK